VAHVCSALLTRVLPIGPTTPSRLPRPVTCSSRCLSPNIGRPIASVVDNGLEGFVSKEVVVQLAISKGIGQTLFPHVPSLHPNLDYVPVCLLLPKVKLEPPATSDGCGRGLRASLLFAISLPLVAMRSIRFATLTSFCSGYSCL
jgi:hypothetical protein